MRLHDSHHRRGFSHEPSVALYHFAKVSGVFLVVWAALLARRLCPARAAVRAADFVALISIAAVLTAAWIAGSAMSWARAFLAVITIAAMFAAAWLELR